MLVYFKVGNYKSIKEPIVINFTASAINEHQDSNVLSRGKDNLLKAVLLYGPNAGGKSKILDALVFFRWLILNSATDQLSHAPIETDPFALNPRTKTEPGFFEAEFYIGKTKYRYGFEADKQAIQKEWLLEIKSTTTHALFLRSGQEFQVEKRFQDAQGLEKRTRKNALFLSVAAQWNAKQAEDIVAWFDSIYTVHGMMDNAYRTMTTDMLGDKRYEHLINQFIRQADLGISGLETMELTLSVKEDILQGVPEHLHEQFKKRMEKDPQPVFAMHDIYNDDGEVTDQAAFTLDEYESEGTRKFYNLAGPFIDAALAGKLLIIDEFDARLHTLLIKAIIHLFNSEDLTSGAQLLGVSHDTAILDRELLRRDQIYFVEKDRFGATHVTTLVEYRARKEEPYYKNYLEGKYGGIPFITNLETTFTDDKVKGNAKKYNKF